MSGTMCSASLSDELKKALTERDLNADSTIISKARSQRRGRSHRQRAFDEDLSDKEELLSSTSVFTAIGKRRSIRS